MLSGGIDSAACVHFLNREDYSVRCIFVNYGQAAARREQAAARQLCKHFGVPFRIEKVHTFAKFPPGELVGRNFFLIACGMFLGRIRSGLLCIGIHSGTAYFDCGTRFFDLMARLVEEQTDGRVALVAPFLDWTKSDIVRYTRHFRMPLDLTYSCELGTQPVCGRCSSCADRRALGVC